MKIFEMLNIPKNIPQSKILEIRLRINKKISILKIDKTTNGEILKEEILEDENQVTKEYLKNLVDRMLKNSMPLFLDQMKSGYFTIEGGHRVGICGEVNLEVEKIKTFRNITSLNIRISHEHLGCSNKIMKELYKDDKQLRNTLIVSPPMGGKTTLLRDIVRNVSNGSNNHKGQNVVIIDERNEIAASYNGEFQNDIGDRTDVLTNIPKHLGVEIALRTMNPGLIALDEIGLKDDLEKIKKGIFSGVSFIATMHGRCYEDVIGKIPNITQDKLFEQVIYLKAGRENFEIGNIQKL